MSEIKSTIISTARPTDRDPAGACEIGHYKVENGFVLMCSEDGKPTGRRLALNSGDNPERVAAKMLREQWLRRGGESDFNRPLHYEPLNY
jgi:hypothetical protein